MDDSIAIKTDLFEHREVKPYFINPCLLWRGFRALDETKAQFVDRLRFLRVRTGRLRVGLLGDAWKRSFLGSPVLCWDRAARGTCGMGYFRVQSLRSRLFRKFDSQRAFEDLRNGIWELLKSDGAIEIVRAPEYS